MIIYFDITLFLLRMNDIIDSLTCSDDIKEELECIIAMHEEEVYSLKEINEEDNKYVSIEV